jgi:deoxyribonuclease (pyrimidine dimer)
MTRINSAIRARLLTDEHLLAEHREIKRMPSVYAKRKQKGSLGVIPEEFTLGAGHVIFFIDKGRFTLSRYRELYEECLQRGFTVTNYISLWDIYEEVDFNDHQPTEKEKAVLIERITERIHSSPKEHWHINRVPVTKEKAIEYLR